MEPHSRKPWSLGVVAFVAACLVATGLQAGVEGWSPSAGQYVAVCLLTLLGSVLGMGLSLELAGAARESRVTRRQLAGGIGALALLAAASLYAAAGVLGAAARVFPGVVPQ